MTSNVRYVVNYASGAMLITLALFGLVIGLKWLTMKADASAYEFYAKKKSTPITQIKRPK